MQKYGHIGTFPMGDTGPHIAILVLSVVPHFNSMVYSKIPASPASFRDCGVVGDDLGEPPRIEGHRPGPLGILNDQDSLLATTAGCQWFRTAGSPSNRPVSVHDPSKSREAASRTRRSFWQEESQLGYNRLFKPHGRGRCVGRAALPAFSAAGCAFEGQDPAQLGSLPATSESTISFSAAAGDASQL